MTSEEHLQISEILAFRQGELLQTDHTAAARHLVHCGECRDLLPTPSPDEFWNCLLGADQEIDEAEGIRTWKSFIPDWSFGRTAVRNAVFAGFLMFAVLGLSFVLLIQQNFLGEESLIAVTEDDRGSPSIIHPMLTGDPDHSGNMNSGEEVSSPSSPEIARDKDDTRPIKNAPGRKIKRKENGSDVSGRRSARRADARGNAPCGGQRSVGLVAKQTDAGLVLKWVKVPRAILYNIYLSDLSERLIDSFKTDDETSYLVTADLEKDTVYRLRLIATLENGERIVSESQDFRVSELKEGTRTLIRKKTPATVRCVEVKQ